MRQPLKLIIISIVLFTTVAFAREIPGYDSPVMDLVGLLTPAEEAELENRIINYRDSTAHEVGVLIIQTLEGDNLEDYANRVYNSWGIGKRADDNGVLMLIAYEERRIRLEVGYGLESALTDLESGHIVGTTSEMAGAFREKEWARGVGLALDGIIAAIGGEYIPPEPVDEMLPWYIPWMISMFVFIMLIGTIILMIARAVGSVKRRTGTAGKDGGGWFGSGWSSGGGSSSFGGGSSFGGFSGGSSGGGGASGGW